MARVKDLLISLINDEVRVMIKPVIVAVGYNRPYSMKRLLDSLANAYYPDSEITLIISIDHGENSADVNKVAESFEWTHGEKKIVWHDDRLGLRRHIIKCGDYSIEYGAVIILEDDLIVSPSYYFYTLSAIDTYYMNKKICGIGLYSHRWNGYSNIQFMPEKNEYDVFFGQFSITWGQCWTATQWELFRTWYDDHVDRLPASNDNIPERISFWSKQSWGKYFASYIAESNLYYVIPYTSMTTNFSEVGQHNSFCDSSHQVPLQTGIKNKYLLPDFENGIKYDMFFERVFDSEFLIGGIPAKDICINLNGTKNNAFGKKYLLTDLELDLPIVSTFGLRMRPIDSNITYAIGGKDVFLYQIEDQKVKLCNSAKSHSYKRMNYECYGYYWKSLLCIGETRMFAAIKRRLRKNVKKRKND